MSCKCRRKEGEIITYSSEKLIHPFETCPLCATKHIGYAIVNYDQNKKINYISEIYLAYKHLEKSFENEAKLCFELINDFFNNYMLKNYDESKIQNVLETIHNLAINYNEEVEEGEPLKLEDTLPPLLRIVLYVLAAGELYNYEVGYTDVNTPYVIGLLQMAAEERDEKEEDEKVQIRKNMIRNVWKQIENNEKIDFSYFYKLAISHIRIHFLINEDEEVNK